MRIIIHLFLPGVLLIAVTGINCDDKITVRQEMLKIAAECYKEMNITQEEENMRLKTDEQFAKLRMHCFSACLMKKSKEIDEDGKPNLEKISEIEHALHPRKAEEVMEVIAQCLEEVKSIKDECDFANAYDDCVHEKSLKIFTHERIP